MKTKTTISLEPELLEKVKRILSANNHDTLSELIEELLRIYLANEEQKLHHRDEREVINQHATRLNEEAEDVLTYQIAL